MQHSKSRAKGTNLVLLICPGHQENGRFNAMAKPNTNKNKNKVNVESTRTDLPMASLLCTCQLLRIIHEQAAFKKKKNNKIQTVPPHTSRPELHQVQDAPRSGVPTIESCSVGHRSWHPSEIPAPPEAASSVDKAQPGTNAQDCTLTRTSFSSENQCTAAWQNEGHQVFHILVFHNLRCQAWA